MSALPSMGGVAPPLQCNRDLNGNPGSGNERLCGREGKWHIIWTSDLENGICCDEHYQEARELWGFYAVHEYKPDCSMPGAVYDYAENICVVDEGGLGLSELVATEPIEGGRHTVRALSQEVWSAATGVSEPAPACRDTRVNAKPSRRLVSAATTPDIVRTRGYT